MNEKYSIEDEAVITQALTYYSTNDVWEKYVEACKYWEDRIYWRNLFFDVLIDFSQIHMQVMPSNMEFVNMVEQWIKRK